ncbi:MAG: cysteine hydrolase [Myxococcales bacterium]|nr:MAG: cysteine hydrolase [Myxococcales bacterium]
MTTSTTSTDSPAAAVHAPLDPATTALLVIDMQRYFVRPDCGLGRLLGQLDPVETKRYIRQVRDVVIPNIQKLLEAFRAHGSTVAFTEFGSYSADGRDMPLWARNHNALGRQVVAEAVYPPFDDASCRVDESLEPLPTEIVVRKNTSGPCNSTKLDHVLRVSGIESVVVAGVATDVCVAQTTREFGDRDFRAIVVEDAAATPISDQTHASALETIGRTFGEVITTDTVVGLLGS